MPWAARAERPPMARNLPARGSGKAPERVGPPRRASQPASPSVQASITQPRVARQETPSATMTRSSGIVRANRKVVTRLAGVSRALGPNRREIRETGWAPMSGRHRHEVRPDGGHHLGGHDLARRRPAPAPALEAHDPVDL